MTTYHGFRWLLSIQSRAANDGGVFHILPRFFVDFATDRLDRHDLFNDHPVPIRFTNQSLLPLEYCSILLRLLLPLRRPLLTVFRISSTSITTFT